MTWSSDGLQYTYTETTESGDTITYVDTYDTAYAAPGSKITATSWSDTNGNSSSISWSTASKTFDYDGNKSTTETTQTVLVESGTSTWTYVDDNSQTQTKTLTFEHYFDDSTSWNHLGGFERDEDDVTTYFKADFEQAYQIRSLSSISTQLDSNDGIEYSLYSNAKFVAETSTGWNGQDLVETTFYDATTGDVVGRSVKNIDTWTMGDETVTSTNTHYEDAAGGWLGNKWSDSNGNQGSYYSETYDGSESLSEVAGFDLDGDSTEGGTSITTYKDASGATVTIDTTNTVRVEQGEDTWTYTDMNGDPQTETRTYTHYYDSNWVHLGGVEVIDGETVKWGANWTFVGVKKSIGSLDKLSETDPTGYSDTIAYKLFGDVYHDTETWLGWNELPESETTYYNANGEKVGSSFTSTNSWTTPDNTLVTSSNTSYNDADWNYLGNEWSEGSNGGWNFEKKLTVDVTEPVADDPKPAISLDGNTTAGETLTQVKIANNANLQSISSTNAVIVREGQDQFSFKDMNNQTVTEDIIYKHYYYDANGDGYWQDSEHIGGYEIRNGETVIYEAGFQQGEKKRDVSSIDDVLTSSDGIAYDLYGAAKYIEDTRLGWNGETEIETTYYSTSGAELGRSFTNINKWTDYFSNQQVTSTNTHYEDAAGGWLGNKWSDSNGNQGSYYSETYDGSESLSEVAGFDLDGDSTEGGTSITTYKDASGATVTIDTTNTVRVEQGEDTWTYTDMNGDPQTETRTYTHYYDSNWVHLGGVEVIDGETVKWGANWTFVGVKKSIGSLDKLSETDPTGYSDTIAYKLFGDVYHDTETWLGWNELPESETTYYNANGEKVGSSFTSTNSWTTPDNTLVTSSNTSYNDADWNYLGNEWSEGSNGGWNFEKKLTVDVTEPVADDPKPAISLDGNTTAGETLTQVKIANNANLQSISSTNAVIVREGQDQFSFKDMNNQTVTEDIIYKHYYYDANGDGYWQDSEHIGGYEIRNGETVIYEAGFQQGEKKRDVSSIDDVLTSSDGIAYDLYGAAKYIEDTRLGWNGETEIETTYYSTSGAELGRSFTNINKWTDYFSNQQVTSTNTHYEDAAGGWLGNKWSDSNGNQGSYYSETYDGSESGTDILTEVAGFDLDGDGTAGESTQITTYKDPNDTNLDDGITDITISSTNYVRVERGEDTWSYTDMNGDVQTETRTYTQYYDKDWAHLGGVEVIDGETVKWGANWTFVGVEKDTSSLAQLSDTSGYADTIAYKLFGDAYYDTETWLGWNGLAESETTYYDITTDEKVGSSFTSTNSWTTPDGTSVTSTNTSYNDADWNYLGNEWSEGSNGGWNFEKKITSGNIFEPDGTGSTAAISLDGDTTTGETLTQVQYNSSPVSYDATNPVIVREGQDQFSFTDMNNQTVTEDIIYKHYYYDANGDGYWQDSEHIGGYEIRNGETVIYEAGFQQGAKKKSLSDEPALTSSVDSVAFSIFDDASYTQGVAYDAVERDSWTGFKEVETTYYDKATGAEIGRSFKMESQYSDPARGTISSENTHYESVDGTFLGNKYSDEDASGNILNSGSRIEKIETITTEPAWLDFDGDTSKGETSITGIELRVETGSDTWSFMQGSTLVSETREYTHYFDKDTFEHLGGSEVVNGVTEKIGPNWTPLGTQVSTTSLASMSTLSSGDFAYTFYNAAKYDFDTSSGETIYYDAADGSILGRSFENSGVSLTRGGQTFTATEIDYRGPRDEFYGSKWYDTAVSPSKYGQDVEYRTTLTNEPTYVDFDNNGTAGEYIAGGREVRIEERSETIDGKMTSSLRYFDISTGILLGGTNSAGQGTNIFTTVLRGNGTPSDTIYGPGGALTIEALLGVSSWSNPTSTDLSQALSNAMAQFSEERVNIQDVFAQDGVTIIGAQSVGSTYKLELTGTGLTFEVSEVTGGTVTTASLYYDGSIIGTTSSLDLPAELIGLIFQSISAAGDQPMQINAVPASNQIMISNSTLSDGDINQLKVQIEDDSGHTLVVHGTSFTTTVDAGGHPINGAFEISYSDLESAIDYAVSGATNTAVWNSGTVITKIDFFEDKNFTNVAEGFEKSASLTWHAFEQAEGAGVTISGADYVLTPSHNIQSALDAAQDVDGDGSIIIALTSGRYTQDFTINDSIEIWGSAQGLAISADGSDADGKVDEISEVKFDLADNVRGVGETWIDGRVTVASDGVKLDGLRLHDADGALAFAGSDIDHFELYNSYVTGFNGANSIRYSDTDGTKSNGWVIDGNLIGGVTGGVGGSLYLTGLEHSVIEDNVFWRPGAAHIYLEDMHYLNVKDNFFVQGLHADGANSDGLLNAIQTSTFGYGGFASGYGYGYGYGYGGPQGAVSDGTASYANQSYDFYGRNYVAEVKGITNGVVFDGNTAKYNSGGIQFWDEDNTSNFFTNTEIRNNVFTDFENADPDGYLATVSSRHKSGIMGGVTFSVADGSASSNLKIEGNSFTGSIGEIYNADDVDSLILIQGEVANVDIAHNDLDWDGSSVSNSYLDFPNDTIYTQGIHLAGDVNSGGTNGLEIRQNIFDTDTPHNFRSDAILLDLNDYSSLGLGQLSSAIAISDPDFASLSSYQASNKFGNYKDIDSNGNGTLEANEIGSHGTIMFVGPNGSNPTITFVNTVPTPQNFSAETLQNIYDGVNSFSLNADSERIYTLSSDKPNVAVAVSVERPSGTVEGLFAVAKHTHDDSEVSIGVLSHHELFRAALGRDPSTDGSARLVANFINEVAPANQLPDSDLPLKILSVGSNPYFSTRQIDGERYTYIDAVDSNEIEGRIHGGFNYEIDTLRADDRHLVVEDILGPQRDWATDYDVVILRPSYERKYIDMALDWAASTGGSLLFSFDAGSFPNNPSYVAPHPEFLDFVENDLGIAIGEPGRLESDTTGLDDYSVTRINPFTTVNLRNYLGLTDGVPGTDASQPLQVTSEMNLVSVATDQNGLKVGDVSWSSSNEAIVSNSGELKAAGSATLAATINGVDGNTYVVNTYIKAFPLLDEHGNSLTQGLTFDIVGWDDDVSTNSDNDTRNFNRVDQTYKDENNIFNLTEIENSGDLLYSFLSADLWIDDTGSLLTDKTTKTPSYSNNVKDEINSELSVSDQPIVAVVSGFIIANETGTHNIKLSSLDKQSELWIETENGVVNKYVDNGSRDISIELKAGEHYKVVALYRDQNNNKDWFELTWREPSSGEYSAIPASNLIARPPQSAVDGNTAGNFFDITDDNYVAPSGTADAVSQSPTSGSNNYDVVWEDVLYDSNYDSGLRFAKSEKFSLDQEYFQAPIQNLILTDTLITEAKSVSLNVYDSSSNELIYGMYNWDFESNAITSLAGFSSKLQLKLRAELGSDSLTVTASNGVVRIDSGANENYLFEEFIVGKSPSLTPDTIDLTQAVSSIGTGTISQMARFSFEADGYSLNNVKVYQKIDPYLNEPDLRVTKQGFIGDNDSDYADQQEYDSAWARHGALEKSLNYYTGDRWDIQIDTISDELVFKVDRDDGNGFVSVTPSKVELHSSSLYDDLIESISEAGRKYSDISIGEIRGEIALDSSDLAPSSPIKIIEQPIYGTVSMTQTGEYKYTPTSEKFKGLDQFHIEITDLHGVEHIQQVVIGKNVPLVDETSEFSEITITEKVYSEPDSSSYDSTTTADQWSFEDVFFAQVAVHRPDNPYLSLVQGRPVTLKLNVSSNGSTNAPKFEVKVYDIDGVLVGSRVLTGPQKMPTDSELDLPSFTNLATDAGHNNDDSYTVEIPGNWLTPGMKIELLANNERINDRTDFIAAYNNTRDTNVAGDYLTPNVIGGGSPDFSIGHFSLGAFNTSYAYVGTTDFAMEMLARIPAESINLLYRSGSTIVETVRNRTDIDAPTIISSDHSLAAGSATYIEMVDTPFGAGVPGWAKNLAQAVKKANFLSPLDGTRYPDWMYSSILPDVGGGIGGGQTGSGNTATTATIHEFLGHGAGIGHPSDGIKTGHVYNNVSGTGFNWVLADADSGNSYEKLGNLGDNWYYDQNSNTYIPNFYVTNIDDIVEAVQKAITYANDPDNLNTKNAFNSGDASLIALYQELANFVIEVSHLGAKGPILNLAEVIEMGSRLPTMYSVTNTSKVFVESISPIYDLRTGPMAGSAGKGSVGQENFSTLIAPFSDFEMHTNLYDRFSNLMQWRPNQTLGQDTEDGGFAGDGYFEYWGLEKDIFTVEDLTGVTGDTRKITGIEYSDAIFDYSQRYKEYGDNLTEDEGGLSSVFKTENGQSLQAGKTGFLQLLDDDPSTAEDEAITEVDALRIDFRNTLDSVFDFTVRLNDGDTVDVTLAKDWQIVDETTSNSVIEKLMPHQVHVDVYSVIFEIADIFGRAATRGDDYYDDLPLLIYKTKGNLPAPYYDFLDPKEGVPFDHTADYALRVTYQTANGLVTDHLQVPSKASGGINLEVKGDLVRIDLVEAVGGKKGYLENKIIASHVNADALANFVFDGNEWFSVIDKLNLPNYFNGHELTWAANDPEIIDLATGKVKADALSSSSAITATWEEGGTIKQSVFQLKQISDEILDAEIFDFGAVITNDISLVQKAFGYSVSWETADNTVITSGGNIGAKGQTTITAHLKDDSGSTIKSISKAVNAVPVETLESGLKLDVFDLGSIYATPDINGDNILDDHDDVLGLVNILGSSFNFQDSNKLYSGIVDNIVWYSQNAQQDETPATAGGELLGPNGSHTAGKLFGSDLVEYIKFKEAAYKGTSGEIPENSLYVFSGFLKPSTSDTYKFDLALKGKNEGVFVIQVDNEFHHYMSYQNGNLTEMPLELSSTNAYKIWLITEVDSPLDATNSYDYFNKIEVKWTNSDNPTDADWSNISDSELYHASNIDLTSGENFPYDNQSQITMLNSNAASNLMSASSNVTFDINGSQIGDYTQYLDGIEITTVKLGGNIHLDFTDLVEEAQLDLPKFELLTADQILGDMEDFNNVSHEGLMNGLSFALNIDRNGEHDVLFLDII